MSVVTAASVIVAVLVRNNPAAELTPVSTVSESSRNRAPLVIVNVTLPTLTVSPACSPRPSSPPENTAKPETAIVAPAPFEISPPAVTLRLVAPMFPSSIAFASTSVTAVPVTFTAPPKSFVTLSSVTANPVALIVVAPVTATVPLSVTAPPAVTFKLDAVTFPKSIALTSTSVTAAPVTFTAPPKSFAALSSSTV